MPSVAQPVLDHERQVEADEQRPEVHLAEAVVHHPAGELREPVVDAAKKANTAVPKST
jgi:hypothetical protein